MTLEFTIDETAEEVTILFDNSLTLTVEKLDDKTFKFTNFSKLANELDNAIQVEKIKKFACSMIS